MLNTEHVAMLPMKRVSQRYKLLNHKSWLPPKINPMFGNKLIIFVLMFREMKMFGNTAPFIHFCKKVQEFQILIVPSITETVY